MIRRTTLFSAVFAMLFSAFMGLSHASEGGHGHKGSHDGSGAPERYAAAVEAITARTETIGSMIEGGDLGDVHHEAEALVALAEPLAGLAARSDSGVERGRLKDVNLSSKRIVALAGELHEVADEGDMERSRALFQSLQAEVRALSTVAPDAADDLHRESGEHSDAGAHSDHDEHGARPSQH